MRGPADADEPDDTAAFEEAGQVSENMLTRLQHRAQGVPASWKDEIEDEEVTSQANPTKFTTLNTSSSASTYANDAIRMCFGD